MFERIVSGVKSEACQRAKILGIGTSASSLSVIAVGFFRKRVGVFGPVFFIRKQLENSRLGRLLRPGSIRQRQPLKSADTALLSREIL